MPRYANTCQNAEVNRRPPRLSTTPLLAASIPTDSETARNTLLDPSILTESHAAQPTLPARLVLSEQKVAWVTGLSVRTLQRARVTGEGPPFIQLTNRRIGYTLSAVEAWIAARQVASTSAVTVAKQEAASARNGGASHVI